MKLGNRQRLMRNGVISAIVLVILIVLALPAKANMPVVDFGAIYQLEVQLRELRAQSEYIKRELDVLKPDQYHWSSAGILISSLSNVMNATNGIAYTAGDLDKKFRDAFPGYKAPQDYNQAYQNNVNTTQNTLNGVLQSMGTSARDFTATDTRMAFLQKQSQSATGQTQAIQASSQIAAEMVTQIQLLRQTIIAQTNAQSVYYASQIQNEANDKADLASIIKAGSREVPAYGSSGNELTSPDF